MMTDDCKPFRRTWHDDVRETESPGDGDVAGKEAHVVLLDLLQVAVQQLQRNGKSCRSQHKHNCTKPS